MKRLILLLAPVLMSAQTVQEAKKFLDEAETRLLALSVEGNRAAWVQTNFITFDTEALFAAAYERVTAEGVRHRIVAQSGPP